MRHVFAIAPDPRVVDAQDDVVQLLLLDGLLENRMEQGPRLPSGAGKDFVVGRPILLRVALETDGAGQRALAHPAQDAKGQGDGRWRLRSCGKTKSQHRVCSRR